jgi:putative membrane protein
MFGYDHHWLGGWWMIILRIILIAAVIYVVFRLTEFGRRGKPDEPTPLDILKRRYAAGEISREEFDGMRQELRS